MIYCSPPAYGVFDLVTIDRLLRASTEKLLLSQAGIKGPDDSSLRQ